MENKTLREQRKRMFDEMERKLKEGQTRAEDGMFYYHSSEDRIVLSHALFWAMTPPQFFKGKIRKEKFFLLLRHRIFISVWGWRKVSISF